MSYLNELDSIADSDVFALRKAEESYGDSWKKRGGVGAFMMLARKWDRIEKALNPVGLQDQTEAPLSQTMGKPVPPFDIFAAAEADPRKEGIIDDIRDLRRYLLLVEAELKARGTPSAITVSRDSVRSPSARVLSNFSPGEKHHG